MSNELYRLQPNVQTRWANAENPTGKKGAAAMTLNGRKGAAYLEHFKPGETRTLAETSGSGIVRHIWLTIEKRDMPETLKGFRLDCFWDGAVKPAVSVPLGDFFCFNTGVLSPMESEFFSNPEGRNFNSWVPMPFRTGMKITITNETPDIEELKVFYQVDYTLGDDTSDALYFHAYYNRTEHTTAKEDYTILPKVDGCGRYLGASFGVIANLALGKTWWGEGEVKCYIDGDGDYPTLAGTGTEDYICTSWGQGRFYNRYSGCLQADFEAMRYAFYRFHVRDVVNFQSDIRVTIQQIGYASDDDATWLLDQGHAIELTGGKPMKYNDEQSIYERFGDDWCSVTYFYLDKPVTGLPALPGYESRIAKYARNQ